MKEEEFLEIFRTAFPVSGGSLTLETRYKELSDWNSMCVLVLITAIGEKYDVSLSPDDALEAETPADLFRLVQSRFL